jgi:hypothetical protein
MVQIPAPSGKDASMVAKHDLPIDPDINDDLEDLPGLTDEEAHAFFDEHARKELGISGEEFLRRWDAGEYRPVPDTPEGRKVGRLVMMLSFAR